MPSPEPARRFDLSGRVAIVTGASRGLGRAAALGLAAAGAEVVVASRRIEACDAVVDEIVHAGGTGHAVAVRMQDPGAVEALVAAAVDRTGQLDIVINNAATVLDRPLEGLDPEAFVGAFTTNLLGPLLLVKAARPHLVASPHAAVVNVVSIAAFGASPGRYLYPPVKAALAQATRTLAADLGPDGIRVNAIAPGTFRTDMVTKAFDDATLDRIGRMTALGRIGEPDEIVGPLLLLVADAGSYLTGHVLTVDAGAT